MCTLYALDLTSEDDLFVIELLQKVGGGLFTYHFPSCVQIIRKTQSPHSQRIQEWLNDLDPHSSTSLELDSLTLSAQVTLTERALWSLFYLFLVEFALSAAVAASPALPQDLKIPESITCVYLTLDVATSLCQPSVTFAPFQPHMTPVGPFTNYPKNSTNQNYGLCLCGSNSFCCQHLGSVDCSLSSLTCSKESLTWHCFFSLLDYVLYSNERHLGIPLLRLFPSLKILNFLFQIALFVWWVFKLISYLSYFLWTASAELSNTSSAQLMLG